MRLLLDTQAFLYMIREPDALPARVKVALEDSDNELWLSVVSPIEIQIKVNKGRLQLARPVRDAVQIEIDRGTFKLLPLTLDHVAALDGLPPHHQDPFDRLLDLPPSNESGCRVKLAATLKGAEHVKESSQARADHCQVA